MNAVGFCLLETQLNLTFGQINVAGYYKIKTGRYYK